MFNTPILLLVFNRPQTAQKVFDEIKKVKPKYLFVAADGPRKDKPEDKVKCEATRQIIHQIDWDCELKTLFREENRGCGRGPAEAITWFFEHVEQGIILEDDCVPSLSFFPFCNELLNYYYDDNDVFMITGTNFLRKWERNNSSYLFVRIGGSLGWASWRRAWNKFDFEMKSWETIDGQNQVKKFLNNATYFQHFEPEFDNCRTFKPDDVWDFQWLFARWVNHGLTIVPEVNLISNIGFHAEATHSVYESDLRANLPLFVLNLPLKHPTKKIDWLYDWVIFEKLVSIKNKSFFKRLILKIVKLQFGGI